MPSHRKPVKLRSRGRMILYALTALALAVTLAGCRSRQDAPPPEPEAQTPAPKVGTEPQQETMTGTFQKARIIWDDEKGRPLWEAEFKSADALHEDGESVVELRQVKASLYSNGTRAGSLTAPRVVADSRTREVRASGGVKIDSAAENASVKCEKLVWKSREGKIVGSGGVRMTRDNLTITASAFESDTSLKRARFTDAGMSLD